MVLAGRLPVPLYHQLERELRERILSGAIPPGASLPAEPRLASQYGVSRATARQALSRLEAAGLVVRLRGRGTFASRPKIVIGNRLQGFTQEIRARGLTPGARTLVQQIVPAEERVAEALDVAPGTEVLNIKRLRCIDGQPEALSEVFLPAEQCRGLVDDDLERNSLYHLLESKYGVILLRAEKEIEAVAAPPDEAYLLEVSPGVPVLLVTKHTFDQFGRPVEYQRAYWRGDRYKFQVTEQR